MKSSEDEAQDMVDDILRRSVKKETAQVVDRLIVQHSARPDVVSKEGLTLLHEAAQHPSPQQALEIGQLLVKKHHLKASQADKRKQTAAFYAAKLGHSQLCEYLLQEGCAVDHVDIAQQTALFYAARNGHVDAAEVFLQHGANIDFKDLRDFTPIFWAAEGGKVKMMKHLVDKNANVQLLSSLGGDIFTSATGDAMKYAVDLGADPKRLLTKKQTNLFTAAQRGDVEKVQACIESYGLDVNHVDENGQTCLFYAAFSGGPVVTQMLLNHKVDTQIADAQGRTAVEYIESKGYANAQVHRMLLAYEKLPARSV